MGNGRSGGWPETAIELKNEERGKLQRVAHRRNAPHREVIRAEALLRPATGERNADIGRVESIPFLVEIRVTTPRCSRGPVL